MVRDGEDGAADFGRMGSTGKGLQQLNPTNIIIYADISRPIPAA
jgi:hypothetical protein